MEDRIVLVVSGVLAAGVAAQWLGWRLRIPPIVFLLAIGLVAGPLTGALEPDRVFGDHLFPLVSMAVAVILFEGALGLGWHGVRDAGHTVSLLLTVGASATLVGTTIAARLLLDASWSVSALIAAVLVVTGPTVIGPIVRSIRLEGRVGAILESEGTLIDPVGAILAVLTFEALFAAEHQAGGGELVVELLSTIVLGLVVGVVSAAVLVVAFRRYLVPDEMHNALTLAAVIGAFAVANAASEEAGLVAVTVMGIALGGQRWVAVHHVLEFNVTLRVVLIASLFVLLGARIEPDTLRDLEWRNLAFLVALVVVVRPVSVLLSTLRTSLSKRERLFLAVTAPRGIVAASVASVFSLRMAEEGRDGAQLLVSAVFTVIAGTVLLSGFASRPLARRLGLIEAGIGPVIVLGANEVARSIAGALERYGAPVRLIDLNRDELAQARMSGLAVRRGSVFADETWEAAGIGSASSFLALTASDELNVLAARHAMPHLGRRSVFQLAPGRPEHRGRWTLPIGAAARQLFHPDATLEELEKRLAEGWRVTGTPITDQFGTAEHEQTHPGAVPLFIVDGRGGIDLIATDAPRRAPHPGETIVALVPPAPSGTDAPTEVLSRQ